MMASVVATVKKQFQWSNRIVKIIQNDGLRSRHNKKAISNGQTE